MDHTLGGDYNFVGKTNSNTVLILVLVDHTLGDGCCEVYKYWRMVLILVLVDHTLGDINYEKEHYSKGLNPCFSGPYSRR